MSGSITIWLVWAVALFWAVGAYNRLVRLRARAVAAFTGLDEQLRLYVTLVQASFAAVDEETAPSLASLLGAALQFDAAIKAARSRPLDELAMRALAAANEVLGLSWVRACSEPPDLAGEPLPDALQQQWQHIAMNADTARAEFKRCVQEYNQAIAGFPARWLARLFGFQSAHAI